MLRTPQEILRVLNTLLQRGEAITCHLEAGKLTFSSRLCCIDPQYEYIALERCGDEAANHALLARPRATLHAESGGWHIEFTAAEIRSAARSDGVVEIRLRFPEILAGHRRRESERSETEGQCALRCVVDEGGVMPFDAILSNVSKGGIGFLQYDPAISLEPGTLLKGCRIDSSSGASVWIDMEVRHSQLQTLADGTRMQSSGCRFLNPAGEDVMRIEELFGLES